MINKILKCDKVIDAICISYQIKWILNIIYDKFNKCHNNINIIWKMNYKWNKIFLLTYKFIIPFSL